MRPLPAALVIALLLSGCKPARGSAPPDPRLIQIPPGCGRPYAADAVLTVKDRALVLPGGLACGMTTSGCAEALAALQGKSIALELGPDLAMAELTVPLSRLTEALAGADTACLATSDGSARRCVPFRPFSGEEFGAWLDAERPLGKIRLVMRSDGLEVVTDRGKVPGPDRFGPSLPPIEGMPDFDGLDRLLARVARRFPDEEEAVLAPSPSLPLREVGRALAIVSGRDGGRFPRTFLVYP